MLKFVKKDEPTKVVMTESDEGEIKIIDYFGTPDPRDFLKRQPKKDEEKCQTESESTE